MSEFTRVADANDLTSGKSICVDFAGEQVAVFNVNGEFYAISDRCTHVGGSLSGGTVDGNIVTCPLHGAGFDLKTGNVTGPPASSPVTCYQVRVEGEDVQIAAAESAAD